MDKLRFEDIINLTYPSTDDAITIADDFSAVRDALMLPDLSGNELYDWNTEELFFFMRNNLGRGLIARACTPKIFLNEGERSYTSSWGVYQSKWVFGETLEALEAEGLKFVQETRDKALKNG